MPKVIGGPADGLVFTWTGGQECPAKTALVMCNGKAVPYLIGADGNLYYARPQRDDPADAGVQTELDK